MNTESTSTTQSTDTFAFLAAGAPSALPIVLVGIAVAAVLLGGFWWGSRRVARRRGPAAQPARARRRARSRGTPHDPPTGPGPRP
ncbi:DUF6479 family protein [Streptomyces sp. NPDC127068]|uniref:DUF6479 family protein n=1 Tax=Streptomyces sp. NPDC127068 TaxID=3347127 RepID=UPI0036673BAF